MNITISELGEWIIRSQIESGRYSSETEVVDAALRRLGHGPTSFDGLTPDQVADQVSQLRLFADGLISEIKPPFRVDTGTERFSPVPIEGEPLFETIIRERR